VGDVAGMGADLFESYVGSILAAATLGTHGAITSHARLALPFWLAAAGSIGSFIGYFFVSTKESGDGWNVNLGSLMWALERGTFVANTVFLILAAVCVILLFGPESEAGWKLYSCVVIGLVSGMAIGKGTEYFTSFDYGPTISIKDRGVTGPATVVIQGMGVGMISTILPTGVLAVAILSCAELMDEYGVAVAAVGMLATLGISLSTDAYGPVADNAGGLAEMAGLGPDVRAKTDSLDALGNTTAAVGKGFAVGSAVLTALSLLAAFKEEVNKKFAEKHGFGQRQSFEVTEPILLSGVLIGAMLPYLFGALTMLSVGKAAAEMIEEVRDQFRNVKNPKTGVTLMEAIKKASQGITLTEDEDVEPDSDRCVMISTRSSVKEMIAPGVYAVLTPLVLGFFIGAKAVMGLLVGTIGSAAMLAVMMGNAGGAWDNAKKLCEKLQIKKTDQGKACVVGDTVGDPYKDTSGPSLDILLKLMAMVSLLIAPLIGAKKEWEDWWVGLFPFGIGLITTLVLMFLGILSWKDPLEKTSLNKGETEVVVVGGKNPQFDATGDSQSTDAASPKPPSVAWS
jgi:H(+)-translocating pyrophosphatase